MKRIMFILLVSIMGLTAADAHSALPSYFDWKQIVCDIVRKGTMSKGRSAVYVPELYQSEQYISVQSEYADYANVYIAITNQGGETVKEDVIQVVAGGENLYYIGDLESGMYEITVELGDMLLCGNLSINNSFD